MAMAIWHVPAPPAFLPCNPRSSIAAAAHPHTLTQSCSPSPASASPLSHLGSLLNGQWVKLICGASFEDAAHVRNLSLVYTLAGVDCIDCAADYSIVTAVREGIAAAIQVSPTIGGSIDATAHTPWVMVSVNDEEDVHFRKANFDVKQCPPTCPRPCERVCPASAIWFNNIHNENEKSSSNSLMQNFGGVLTERCYGCGRCIPVCPFGLIGASSYVRDPEIVSGLFKSGHVDAVEIHTNGRNLESFKILWERIHSSAQSLKLVAVSLPDLGDDMVSVMWDLYRIMRPDLRSLNIWQLDGRPMSGDIGAGATKAVVDLATRIAACQNRPPGFLQLAGGTNAHTVRRIRKEGFCEEKYSFKSFSKESSKFITNESICRENINGAPIAGIAYGGYARKIVCRVLEKMDCDGSMKLENQPLLLEEAFNEARNIVRQLKRD